MSDNYNGVYVSFQSPLSKDQLDTVKVLIGSIKGVIRVEENVLDPKTWFSQEPIKHELYLKIVELFR